MVVFIIQVSNNLNLVCQNQTRLWIEINKKEKMGNLESRDFFEVMELNLGKYEFINLVFFQVGILYTSKYSTWKHREKQGTNQRRELF